MDVWGEGVGGHGDHRHKQRQPETRRRLRDRVSILKESGKAHSPILSSTSPPLHFLISVLCFLH